MTEEVPSDASRTRLIALVVSGAVLALALIGAGVWALTRPGEDTAGQSTFEPAQETSAAPLPVAVPTQSAEPTAGGVTATSAVTPDGGSVAGGAATAAGQRMVAFNLGGRIYVSDVTGARITPVGQTADTYVLSPDGTKLAVTVPPGAELPVGASSDGRVAVIDVATQTLTEVGSNVVAGPVSWSPDSQWLAYTAVEGDRFAVKRVGVDGSADKVLVSPAVAPRISRDGTYVAYRASEQPGSDDPILIMTLATKKKRTVPESRAALAWGWGEGGTLYFTRGGASPEDWDLWRHKAGTKTSRKVGSVSLEAPAYALHDVMVSPDGKRVFLTAGGDDHYSRLWVVDASTGRFSQIQTRRDAYACCWAGNDQILYFEGNTYQGETSALASINADGTGRRLIITGAHR